MQNNKGYNPDVLSCLANLSNDEVFTPPQMANQILDLLPQDIWSDKNATFLDPVCKSGVFLREIAKRLLVGLETAIPDQQERINHIYRNQLFGIAITELTSLLSRRSVYCSKAANGKYSICETFNNPQGNLRFEWVEHTWVNGKCQSCGASQEIYAKGEERETHAYQFIHTSKPGEIFDMKFDVIIGNPPYQLDDGGAKASAIPLYHKFVEQAKKLNPHFLTMIIPSRWFAGGRGLDKFREEMLHDDRLRRIIDYPQATDCFPGIDISGGVCYFLWDRDNRGECEITTFVEGKESSMKRPLLEKGLDTFIRYNEAVPILHKVFKRNEKSFSEQVSSQKPFGLRTYAKGKTRPFTDSVRLYGSTGETYIKAAEVTQKKDWINRYKVYISRAYGERIASAYWVTGKPFLGEPGTCCSETYVVIGPCSSKEEAENIMSYIRTQFFRFLVLLIKNTQDAPKKVYSLVPVQDFTEPWTDEKLYRKYGLDEKEIAFIESMVRPMELKDE
ncbi:MAG: Eco57I restriction-modification methylase domain-containing protein [Armatimonadota bacterium]|nr:Eco57I restriction-modification methylase domain-containing protein [Armatimonadota bacterium]